MHQGRVRLKLLSIFLKITCVTGMLKIANLHIFVDVFIELVSASWQREAKGTTFVCL
jgi:hypothetical protein